MDDVKTQIRAYLLSNFLMGGTADELRDDTSFIQSHVLDSMGFVELITHVEETFGIKVEEDEMVPANFDSVAKVAGFIARKRSAP